MILNGLKKKWGRKMSEIQSILADINEGFNSLFHIMDSGDGLVKCPYCKYDVYMHKEQMKRHLIDSHSNDKRIYHKHGDVLESLRL